MIFPEPLDGLRDAVSWPVLPVTPALPVRRALDLEPFSRSAEEQAEAAEQDNVVLSPRARRPCVGEVMRREVITISPDKTVHQLEALLLEHKISGVPVTENGTLLGVVSQGDLVRHHYGGNKEADHQIGYHAGLRYDPSTPLSGRSTTRVWEIMTPYIFYATEDATVLDVLEQMLRNHIHRVLVTRERRLVGVLTSMDLLEQYRLWLLEES